MANEPKNVEVKKQMADEPEKTMPGRFFVPDTDISETEHALHVVMDMPGVPKERIEIRLENNVLTVEGTIDVSHYEGFRPVYSEYPLGHYHRSFKLSNEIDQSAISATTQNGVLSLTLPKAEQARPRRITVN